MRVTSKTKKKSSNRNLKNKPLRKLAIFSFLILLIKFLIIGNIPKHLWLGADGLNYLKAINGLFDDGIFSKEGHLVFFPAGYPVLVTAFSLFHRNWIFLMTAVFQSVIFSFSVFILGKQLLLTSLKRYEFLICASLLLNPTLSLNSMVLGYESLVASGFILVLALIVQDLVLKDRKIFHRNIVFVGLIFSLMSFIQPRIFASGIIGICVWLFMKGVSTRSTITAAAIFLSLMALFPASLVARNDIAGNGRVISNNLGITMAIGSGEGATGGFGVPRKPCALEVTDSARIKCVLGWYLEHPSRDIQLLWNKSIYFWSPWSGPVANGTSSFNPWLKIDPVMNMYGSESSKNLVTGIFGKSISYAWLFGQFIFMCIGLLFLIKSGGVAKAIGVLSTSMILVNWIVSLLTFGDNRYRLPVMPFSILLQVMGIMYCLRKIELIAD